ncbi:hypothetical protein [Methanoculleus sp.]|jgi:hypothetical protein|uniref:hypothetical protein n=1 Tax=Methanoculleus sp. TaxID=90427 RepID=UPI0025EA27C7|nr:hypothetical protein [Methanoculleus sp.]MCK9319357.1 hypothetical protein [Methanoculleus sp.]
MSENVEKKEFVVIYDNLTFSDKVGLIERGLERRLQNLPQFKKVREEEIAKILDMKKQIEERIEKFKDDELIVNGLKANLEEFEKTYVKIANDHKTDIEEAEKTIPQVETLLIHINNVRYFEEDTELLECIFDIFLSNVIRDWAVFEEMEKEEKKEGDGNETQA